jgi:hypothetical protein
MWYIDGLVTMSCTHPSVPYAFSISLALALLAMVRTRDRYIPAVAYVITVHVPILSRGIFRGRLSSK